MLSGKHLNKRQGFRAELLDNDMTKDQIKLLKKIIDEHYSCLKNKQEWAVANDSHSILMELEIIKQLKKWITKQRNYKL